MVKNIDRWNGLIPHADDDDDDDDDDVIAA